MRDLILGFGFIFVFEGVFWDQTFGGQFVYLGCAVTIFDKSVVRLCSRSARFDLVNIKSDVLHITRYNIAFRHILGDCGRHLTATHGLRLSILDKRPILNVWNFNNKLKLTIYDVFFLQQKGIEPSKQLVNQVNEIPLIWRKSQFTSHATPATKLILAPHKIGQLNPARCVGMD